MGTDNILCWLLTKLSKKRKINDLALSRTVTRAFRPAHKGAF
jgi:hypothetical protein